MSKPRSNQGRPHATHPHLEPTPTEEKRGAMITYAVEVLESLSSDLPDRWQGMDQMSPFVIRQGDRYRSLVRFVPAKDDPNSSTGYIVGGTSEDGLKFVVDREPAITAGGNPDDTDAGGCEDPTIVATSEGDYLVYYTGVDAGHTQGSLNFARGPDLGHLEKRGIAMQAPKGEGNIKEATLAQTTTGEWRLFFEYAAENHGAGTASRIGMATGPSVEGPWTPLDDPFTIRNDSWDDFHLSTGPICIIDGQDPVMFYNGATKDARWRIGWVSFDADFTHVTGRGVEPVIVPPPPKDRDATDIAFAASTIVEDDRILLYFSIEDRALRRARIRMFRTE